jgi:hypothetical protein
MGAYSTDPREKIVASVKKGVPESEAAHVFDAHGPQCSAHRLY